MLLRHKKTQEEDQNWCVILSPIPSEIDRKKVAQKISSVFTLSLDEAQDLVANTPIIILDNLTRTIASKLKEFFQASGAETILTNDIFQKRKCYRTVWPEPPSLSFLHDWKGGAQLSKPETQALRPEEAIEEIRFAGKEENDEPQPSLTSIPFMTRTEREQLAEEAERWRKECMKLHEETKELRGQIDRLRKESMLGFSSGDENDWAEEKEKEIKEAQFLLENANEKYEALRQEYAAARQLYEEKIGQLLEQNEQAKKKLEAQTGTQKNWDAEKQELTGQLKEKENEISRLAAEAAKEKQLGETLRLKNAELSESQAVLKREKELFEENLKRRELDAQSLTEENRVLKTQAEQKAAGYEEEKAKLDFQLRGYKDQLSMLQRAKEELDQTLNTQSEQILHWRHLHDEQQKRFVSLEQEWRNEKTLREAFEIRQRELEKNQVRLLQEIEEKKHSIEAWEMRAIEAERLSAELKEAAENQEKMIQHQSRQLEAKEKELENARRQVREINAQIEQRETVQRRTLLASQLVEKETALKKLIQEQEKIEFEIKAREESMRAVLAQQEAVEKDIIEAKQAQRHLAELAKRDQKGRKLGVPQGDIALENSQHD